MTDPKKQPKPQPRKKKTFDDLMVEMIGPIITMVGPMAQSQIAVANAERTASLIDAITAIEKLPAATRARLADVVENAIEEVISLSQAAKDERDAAKAMMQAIASGKKPEEVFAEIFQKDNPQPEPEDGVEQGFCVALTHEKTVHARRDDCVNWRALEH